MGLNKIIKKIQNILLIIFIMCFSLNKYVVAVEDIYLYDGDFTIEEMIKKYNVVTLGTREPDERIESYTSSLPYGGINKLIHIVGPILVEGNLGLQGGQTYHSQFVNGVSSYIKGQIIASGGAGGTSTDNSNPKFYIGSLNEVEQPYPPQNNYHINGFQWYTTYETIKTDFYIDFNKLYTAVVDEQKLFEEGEVVNKSDDGNIYIKTGGVYTINSLEAVKNIVLTSFYENQGVNTLINIKDAGDDSGYLKFPRIVVDDNGTYNEIPTNDYYGKTGNDNEKYKGNIVWSVTGPNYIVMDKSPFIGHFIAPNADVKMEEMHFAGCFVVNSIEGAGSTEAHMYPFTNDILPKDNNVDGDIGDDSSSSDTELDNNDNLVGDSSNNNDNLNNSDSMNDSDSVQEEIENPATLDNITKYSLFTISAIAAMLLSYLVLIKIKEGKEN